MGQIVLTDVNIVFGGAITIGTNAIKSCTINFTPDVLDNTGMGHTAKSRKLGMPDWSIDIEIFQSYVAAELDANLWAIMEADGDVGSISITPNGADEGADNPAYESAHGLLESYSPIAAGSVGELAVARLRILAMGATMTVDRNPAA